MTPTEKYWKERAEAAEEYARLKGNSIDESWPEEAAREKHEAMLKSAPPASVDGEDEARASIPYADEIFPDDENQSEWFAAKNGFIAGARWRGEQQPVSSINLNAIEKKIDAALAEDFPDINTCCARWVKRQKKDPIFLPIDQILIRIKASVGYIYMQLYKSIDDHGNIIFYGKSGNIVDGDFEWLDESTCTCQQVVFPTREEAEAWCKTGNNLIAYDSEHEAAIAMYDWIAEKINQQKHK